MKDELTTILDAMRAAQAELADYLVSADRNANWRSPSSWAFSTVARSSRPCGCCAPWSARTARRRCRKERWPRRV